MQPKPSVVAAKSAWKVLFWMCIAAVVQTVINNLTTLNLPEWTVIPLTALLKAGASWIETRQINVTGKSVLFGLLIALLLCGFLTSPAQCGSILEDQTSFQVAYAHAIKGDTDGMIGKLCVDVWEKQVAEFTTFTASVDLNAAPIDGKTKFGVGASVMIGNGVVGIGLGVTYLPKPYEWTWTVTAVKFDF